jgi:hypothetical protein
MFKITRLLAASACLAGALTIAGGARAERLFYGGTVFFAMQGYQVAHDSDGVASVPPDGAWVQFLDGNASRRYRQLEFLIFDRSPTDNVICAAYGLDEAGNRSFGTEFITSGIEFTGRALMTLEDLPDVVTKVLVLQCWLAAPTSLGSSALVQAFATTY